MTELALYQQPPPPDEHDPHLPPQDVDAERAVIGSIMLSTTALEQCAEILTPTDLYRPAHEAIYRAALTLHHSGQPVDAITVADQLTHTGELQRAGGSGYLHQCIAGVATAANAPHHAEIIVEKAKLRTAAAIFDRAQAAVLAGQLPADDLLATAEEEITRAQAARQRITLQPLADTIEATLDRIEQGITPHIPTGWPELDKLIHGWRPGALHVAGARPGGGKSLLGLQAALAVATQGKAVALATMEMDAHELNLRILAQTASVGIDSLARHNLSAREWEAINPVVADIAARQVYVDDAGEQSVAHIRAHARKVARRHQLGMIVVDYLQLVQTAAHMRSAKRHEQVDDIAAGLKRLARELDVPVLALSQINRGPEARADKRPTMSDFRESGGIENHADVAILLHREDPHDGLIQCQVGKARSARTGSFELAWQGHFARLASMQRPAS